MLSVVLTCSIQFFDKLICKTYKNSDSSIKLFPNFPKKSVDLYSTWHFFMASHILSQFICPIPISSLIIRTLRARILFIYSLYISRSLFHFCLCICFITDITWSVELLLSSCRCLLFCDTIVSLLYSHVFILIFISSPPSAFTIKPASTVKIRIFSHWFWFPLRP